MAEEVGPLLYLALGAFFLGAGIFILSLLFSAINPYERIAVANTEMLRSAINEVCATNHDVSGLSLNYPQNVPVTGSLFSTVLWMLKSNGDPNFAVYYEAFPPGDAIGWEVYQEFNERLLVPLPEDFDGKSGSEAETYVKAVLDTYRQKKPTGAIDGVIIDNVILSDSFRSDFLLNKQDTSGQQKMFGVGGPIIQSTNKATDTVNSNSIGKWFVADKTTGIPVGGDNQFVFANPLGLSALEKTTIKYQPCGANALCLKTPERVYRYPLDQCSDIKAVQLYYDTRNDLSESKKAFWKIPLGFAIIFGKRFGLVGKSVGGVIFEDGLADYFQVFNSLRESDFSLVSPCKLTTDLTTSPPLDVTIHKGSCDSVKIPNFEAEKPCSMFVSYPIFSYDPSNDKFHKVGTHNACVDSIGTDVNVPSSSQEHLYQPTDQCIQVIVTKYLEGYCWTPNTYKKNIGLEFTTGITSRILFGIPIFDNSAYLQMGVVILKGVQAAQSGEGFFPDQGKRFWWGWPGF